MSIYARKNLIVFFVACAHTGCGWGPNRTQIDSALNRIQVEVCALVHELNSEDAESRENAQVSLESLSTSSLQWLSISMKDATSPEVRGRLSIVICRQRRRLDIQQALDLAVANGIEATELSSGRTRRLRVSGDLKMTRQRDHLELRISESLDAAEAVTMYSIRTWPEFELETWSERYEMEYRAAALHVDDNNRPFFNLTRRANGLQHEYTNRKIDNVLATIRVLPRDSLPVLALSLRETTDSESREQVLIWAPPDRICEDQVTATHDSFAELSAHKTIGSQSTPRTESEESQRPDQLIFGNGYLTVANDGTSSVQTWLFYRSEQDGSRLALRFERTID